MQNDSEYEHLDKNPTEVKQHVKVDIMGKEGEDEQEGFLTALLTLPSGREVVLMADDEPSYNRDHAAAEKFIEGAREEARKLGADFEVGFDLDCEFESDTPTCDTCKAGLPEDVMLCPNCGWDSAR